VTDGGYEWCEALSSCVRPWETSCPDDHPHGDGGDNSGSSGGGSDTRVAPGLGLFGLWLAMAAGYAVVALIAGVAVLRSDWEAIVRAAAERSAAKSTATTTLSKSESSADPVAVVAVAPPVRSLNRVDVDATVEVESPPLRSRSPLEESGASARLAASSETKVATEKGLTAALLPAGQSRGGLQQQQRRQEQPLKLR
jgi:hypothetical protein